MTKILTSLAMLLSGLALISFPAGAQQQGPLVLAAASLQEALTEAADSWAAKGNARPILSFAASSVLARQVAAGAPADLFISADEPWMDYLATRRLIRPETRKSFLANRLVLVAPATSQARLVIASRFPLARALGAGRLAIADPDAVPAGRYAKAALIRLAIWPDIVKKLARTENVRAALLLVERGVTPFGIVYTTDAHASQRVRIIGIFPADSHDPITYPLARLKSSTHPEAELFRRFLLSPTSKAIFARHAFLPR